MRYFGAIALLAGALLLAGCLQTPAPPQPAATRTPGAPSVINQSLPTATPTTEPAAAPTASPTVAPTAEPTAETLQEPTATPTSESQAQPGPSPTSQPAPGSDSASSEPACEDKAAFYDDITVPDDTSFRHNVPFEKIWRIRNVGTCAWDGYTLVWAGGSLLDAPLSNPIPFTAPGSFVDIGVNMKSPNKGGVYLSQWQFQSAAGRRFGVNAGGVDLIWARISVTWYPEGSSSPAVSTLPAPAGGCNLARNPAYIDRLLELINNARGEQGLAPLTLEPRLSAAAQAHSEDMACKNYMDHTGSDGSTWAERVKAQGYVYSYVSENIYAGDPAFGGDADGAFDWWMNSQVHRDNILSSKITQIGIGFAASDGAQFKGRYTLNFARP